MLFRSSATEDERMCAIWMSSGLWISSGRVRSNAEAVSMSLLWKKVNDTSVACQTLPRSEQQLQARWEFLLSKMVPFTAFYNFVRERYPSSISGDPSAILATARSLFKGKFQHEFEYLNCWEILKDMLLSL